MRRIFLALLASATFGGVIGAMATAVTQSQAVSHVVVRPNAVAVPTLFAPKVQDPRADRTLKSINKELAALHNEMVTVARSTYEANYRTAQTEWRNASSLFLYLEQICRNTASGGSCQTVSAPPAPEPPPSIP
jgi:hypothetical protein